MGKYRTFIVVMVLLVSASKMLTGCSPEVAGNEFAPMPNEISAPAEIYVESNDDSKSDEISTPAEIIDESNDEYGEDAFDTELLIPEPIEPAPGPESAPAQAWQGAYAGITRTLSTLHMTGEFLPAEQMEVLKARALSWQAESLGIGPFARFVVIEPADNSGQQVYISLLSDIIDGRFVFDRFEKIRIQSTGAEHVRFLGGAAGGGSGELILAFRFIKDDYEWIEVFFLNADWFFDNDYVMELPNITYGFDDNALQQFYDYRVFR